MKKFWYIIILLLVLAVMEGIAWMIFQSSKEPDSVILAPPEQTVMNPSNPSDPTSAESQAKSDGLKKETNPISPTSSTTPVAEVATTGSETFPALTTEVINGRTERTIHMGVRQYAWDPAIITAKRGELVRLIIHNADVKHGLVIPDLGVNQDILPDGAVIEFVASKVGTFEFFCSVWCGEGHMEMQGKIVIK